MTTDDARRLQARLGVRPDGLLGPVTYAALFNRMAERQLAERGAALGRGSARCFQIYGIDTPLRLAHFLAQASHETGNFRYMREIWGPTAAQSRYEGREDLGNCVAGDGHRFLGRGIFQLTGRGNYAEYGELCEEPLLTNPELAEDPEIAVDIACLYWRRKGLNALADRNDIEAITRKINGGLNGLVDRKHQFGKAWGLVR